MGTVKDFKNITNWDELFDMTNEYLTFLVEQDDISHDLVIKTTHDIIRNAGYNYTYDEVEEHYYSGF